MNFKYRHFNADETIIPFPINDAVLIKQDRETGAIWKLTSTDGTSYIMKVREFNRPESQGEYNSFDVEEKIQNRLADLDLAPRISSNVYQVNLPLYTVSYIVSMMEDAGNPLLSVYQDYSTIPDEVVEQIQDQIRMMHEAGIIHADLHDENVLINDDGHIKFIDFEKSFQIDDIPDDRLEYLITFLQLDDREEIDQDDLIEEIKQKDLIMPFGGDD